MIKSRSLFSHLTPIQRQHGFLFDMANEILNKRFLPIKCYDVKMKWMGLLVWDNEKEILHGPYQAKGGISGSYAYMTGYKWEDGELFVYFEGNIDYCLSGLEMEKVEFEQV